MTWIADLAKAEVARNPDSRSAREAVSELVRAHLMSDPDALDGMIAPVVDSAVANEIARARSAAKATIKRPEIAPPAGMSLAVAEHTAKRSMLRMIIGNKFLADCRAGDLATAIAQHNQSAAGNLRMATFLAEVSRRIGGRSVGESLDDVTLRTLFENVGKTQAVAVA